MKSILPLATITITAILLLAGCSDKEKEKSLTEGGMKCGAGKCGSSMVDGSAVLVKKKVNILDQLTKEDKRRDCVLKAKTTKALYNCVRDPKTGRLTVKETSISTFKNTIEATEKKAPKKADESIMKCQAGKCTSGK
ncbi:hypothetical protein [Sulfurovum riftiae]|uniref:Lipoprotein n=1 Tax=Sulfurovum riftiae TaxID=1630136 RepID=A0A151CEH8_9BACT|nr:hypothetical protein [Sulfurovum riftiae]KYJ85936.1 hypothetical protein AS592_04945 [Sulfurovum riftiae]